MTTKKVLNHLLKDKWYIETEVYWIIAKGSKEEIENFMASHSSNEPITEIRPATAAEIKKFYQDTGLTYYNT